MTAAAPTPRRGYLDWLRGVAVLIMIQGHVTDSWTLLADRQRTVYGWITLVGGLAAPMFLFLAGAALVLGAQTRVIKGRNPSEAAATARKHGWQVFGLAFLFRLQSWIISGGAPETLLKVDILNIMGPSMLATALLWGASRGRWPRAATLMGAAIAVAMLTPVVRAAGSLDLLPDPLERYLRPFPGGTTFTLFPWAGFVLAGGALGVWLGEARSPRNERLLNIALVPIGIAIALGAYGASFLPAIYEQTSFWTSSPTFFFLRVGIVVLLLPLAYAWNTLNGERSWLREYGRSSLLVYWVHVELVYGVLTLPFHRKLPLEQAYFGFIILSGLLFGVVKVKNGFMERRRLGRESVASRPLAATLLPGSGERPLNSR